MKKIILILCALTISAQSVADHHAPTNGAVSVIYECTLNEGVSPADVVAFGKSTVNKFATNNDLKMNSYLWEAIAINPPYDEADVRWVNYFPTWVDYYASNEVFGTKGQKVVGEFYGMVTCDKPVILGVRNLGGPIPTIQEKPLIASVCQLNDGKTMQDAMEFVPKMTKLMNKTTGANVASSIFVPAFGISGFDYVGMFTGATSDMATLMDSVRSGAMPTAMAKAGMQPAAACVNDLHQSHLMIQQQQ